jgi:RHS repeat-associated protein
VNGYATTGLYYDHARFYDASAGRFLSQDSKGFAAGDTNLYRYVNNAPTDAIDPSGLDKTTVVTKLQPIIPKMPNPNIPDGWIVNVGGTIETGPGQIVIGVSVTYEGGNGQPIQGIGGDLNPGPTGTPNRYIFFDEVQVFAKDLWPGGAGPANVVVTTTIVTFVPSPIGGIVPIVVTNPPVRKPLPVQPPINPAPPEDPDELP